MRAKLWKQSRCPTTTNGLRKCGIFITMEFYSTTKNDILLFAGGWNGRTSS
jgi:hypothetical protein